MGLQQTQTPNVTLARSLTDVLELQDLSQHANSKSEIDVNSSSTEARNVSELPPVDRGRQAWGFILGAIMIEGLGWGFLFSFGVFQKYLTSQPAFASAKDQKAISSIGTVGSGLSYLTIPIFQRFITSPFPAYRREHMLTGLGICLLGFIAASFAKKTWGLILTQGVLFGSGLGLLTVSSVNMLNEWFVARRGLAIGIVFGGGGAFGIVLPPLLEKLLTSVGYANTMRIWSAIFESHNTGSLNPILAESKVTSLTRYPFANLLQAIGYFIPGIYLPSYASDINISPIQSSLLVSLLNLALVFGQIGLGGMSDLVGPVLPPIISAAVGGASVALLWGLSKSFALLSVFSLIYGASAGGYSSLWTKLSMEVTNDPYTQMAVWGFFTFERGIGNIISGPVSAGLLGSSYRKESYAVSKYENMVIFTGAVMAISALGMYLGTFEWKHLPRTLSER